MKTKYELRLLNLETMVDEYINTVDSLRRAKCWCKCNIPNSRYIYYYIEK